jgi:predicted RNase H-like HicB family nuclease
MKKRNKFTVSDGEMVLILEPAEEGGYIVTSTFEPELITEAETLEDAFEMARDAIKALRASRAKLHRKLALSKGAP